MSNSENSNSSASENSQKNQPMAISDSESSQENKAIPMSTDSSIIAHERPLKRVRAMYNNLNNMIQENPTDIAMPSQENPINTAGSSQPKQPPFPLTCSFKHARHLKFAIEALCDPALDNYLKLGRIDADVNGFNVTVQNSSNNVVAHLCLKTYDFSCTKAIESKIVNLHVLHKTLTNLENDNEYTIIKNEEESDDLFFFAVAGFRFKESVPLLENNAEIPKFPEMSHFCKAVVPDDHFSVMLEHLLQQATHEVLVEITENSAMPTMLMVKIGDSWKHEYPMLKRVAGRRGLEPGKSYCASFQWTNTWWLNKASDMDTTFEVSLHTEPHTYIVLSFVIKDVGYLEYMKEPIP